jgi:hypothetical protein
MDYGQNAALVRGNIMICEIAVAANGGANSVNEISERFVRKACPIDFN